VSIEYIGVASRSSPLAQHWEMVLPSMGRELVGWTGGGEGDLGAGPSLLLKQDVLGAFPDDAASELFELRLPLDDGQEVVAGQLTHLAGEAG